ncbi:tRNA synthetases class I (I L M and V) putative (M) tRNA synthetases class I (C) catalytic domain [Trypanosoma vivax]|uniref:leucine--tRNA ligase n=1 Tax=Trypanosoma vivax (strain Y486) TaxID=1055687 RepID=G0UAS4_TRYVY|nr:putative leucyl-tRNA synthetase [Trypanosoma vivax]KAH8611761.1 tRNA synthetases class I (I L M and V) putative (M) tRNA synthetases class I (C) catalytic domain [Trypanosoma vivax]CCC52910.1 putative leucyl-tRNA synthetase [Trypanosoma vivax Y486]
MTARRDRLLKNEEEAQLRWARERLHDLDAPAGDDPTPKFFVTFPYPYMNGRLHLGHAFSLTKCEFTSRFRRMKGFRSLWPFGLHVTGTPIAACAQKIKLELELYGNPPQFPAEVQVAVPEKKSEEVPIGQYRGKRGKVGPAKPQWTIMSSMGIPEDDIAKFADPLHWLDYFPPLAIQDLKRFGCHIDFRRSFITTDRNPYYDRFVSWQFRLLRRANVLNFGSRYCVYSPLDGQPCADHDRASGEGALPQEYTLVKLRVKNPLVQPVFAPFSEIIGDLPVILPCATLRPETVCGQTNCWISPNFPYKAYTVRNKAGKEEIFIMTARSARNLAYQNFVVGGKTGSDPEHLFEVEGAKLVGLPLSAPLCPYDTIYTLPMPSISETKGTGIVMSVPSDSPDDYINFTQLVKKPDYRAKLGLKDEWVAFDPVPIIRLPGELGCEGAKYMCEKLKINGPNATDLLEEAKKVVYQAGFYHGVMVAGPFAEETVAAAKVKTYKLMEESDSAVSYYEPSRLVTSRSGDDCVVALCNQWYIEYGKDEWKAAVLEHLRDMELAPGTRNCLEETLNWLADWPCSRTFGLGTKFPCDEAGTMIIDSLSDSTIYMAYYTIAHLLHTSPDGTLRLDARHDNILGVTPEMFTDETFDYVFKGEGTPETVHAANGLPVEAAKRMRREFQYWYPVDLRCSAKDLIQNHLTMFLYTHAAIWPDDKSKWPCSIFANGHIQVDGEKMSKSKGNFLMLNEAISEYGSDPTRLACADAGDTLDDANFVRETACGFICKLTNLMDCADEMLKKKELLRDGELNIFDKIFKNTVNSIIMRAEKYYTNMQFRNVLNVSYYELTNEFGQYKLSCDSTQIHVSLAELYVETITLLLAPLAPHFSEYMWSTVLGKETSVVCALFPKPTAPVEYKTLLMSRIITDVVKEIRAQVTKLQKKRVQINEVCVYTSSAYLEWQVMALELLREVYEENHKSFPAELSKEIMSRKQSWMTKDVVPEAMAFLSFVRMNVEQYGEEALTTTPVINDMEVLKAVHFNLCKLSGVANVNILSNKDETFAEHRVARKKCRPGEPTVAVPEKKKG